MALKLSALAVLAGFCLLAPGITRAEPISDANATIFGPNVYVFNTNMANSDIQNVCTTVYNQMQTAQFAAQGYALLFKPGTYYVDCNVGFYTQVAGLGQNPDDVLINGGVNVNAQWYNGEALNNFWRTMENFAVLPTASDTNTDTFPGITRIAVSQAAPIRRLHVEGELDLFDLWPSCHCGAGYASGGFLADSKVDGNVAPASQQQWLSRNSTWALWGGAVWNMVFVGCQNAPGNTFPSPAYTVVAATPVIREKPYLYIDGSGNFAVFVPALQTYTVGPSWANGPTPGTSIPISKFHIAQPATDTAATLNAALAAGKNILFTPGTYALNGTLTVDNANTILLGLGVPSLKAMTGLPAVSVADVDGVTIAGLIIDAGPVNSPVLLQVGPAGSSTDHSANPTFLYDLTVRTGGPAAGRDDVGVVINSGNVVMDDNWIWRADHGNGVGWTTNPTKNGLIVNGNNVTCYGLFNEHHEQYQTIWNGNGGQVYMYQSEIPYDIPNQASWMNGSVDGYASYKVADNVTSHEAWGVGVYCYFQDAVVTLNSAIEVPDTSGVKLHDLTTVWLDGQSGSQIAHIVNNLGGSVTSSQTLQTLTNFIGSGAISNQPAAPTILTVTTNYGQVSLTWSAVASATSYNVKRATTSGTETTIAATAATNYTDTSIVNGITYYYVVTAVANGVESPNSAEVTATPPVPPMPAPPSGTVFLNFTGQGDSVPSPDSSGFYWNNISTVAATVGGTVLPLNGSSQPIPLVNTTNGNSGWTLAINQLGPYGFDVASAPDGDGWNGPYPAAVASFPKTALAYGFTLGGPISVTLSGLNSGLTYNLLVYGANTEWNQAIQTNTLTVGTNPSLASNTFNPQGNDTTAVGWTNVTPGAGGQIVLTITPSAAGALNFMEVSPTSTNTLTNTNPPAAPAILNVTTNFGQVGLTWSAVATATSYNVKRATTSGAETTIATTASTSYTDTNVVNGTKYYYVVSAINSGGESPTSAEITATPTASSSPPPQVSGNAVLVDFNQNGSTPPSPDAKGRYWNDAVITQGGGGAVAINGSAAPMALVNTTNANSGWTLAITNLTGWNSSTASSWLYYNGPYPAVVSNFPSTALNQYVSIGDAGNPGPAILVTFSGLATNSTYNLLTYGAGASGFGAVGGPQTNTLKVGASASPATVGFNALNNSTTVVGWSNITPSALGRIVFTIDALNGGALNFMEVTPNTPTNAPTTLGSITTGAGSGNSLTLNWTASASVHMQSVTSLVPPVVWSDVPNTTGQSSATITLTNTQMFFRLFQP